MRTDRPVPEASILAITMAAAVAAILVAVKGPIVMVIVVALVVARQQVRTIRIGKISFPAMMRRSSTSILGRNSSGGRTKSAIVLPANSGNAKRKGCIISILTTNGCRNSSNGSNMITIIINLIITIMIIMSFSIITIITVTSKMLMFFRAQNSG